MNYWLVFWRTRREWVENQRLLDRLNMGIRLIEGKIIDKIICSWWAYHSKEIETEKSESWHMKDYLIQQWVPESNIIIEDRAKETIWNLIFSIETVWISNISELFLISSDDHITRIVQYCQFLWDLPFKYTAVWVHTFEENSQKLGINRTIVEERASSYCKTVFNGCNSIDSFKDRLFLYYFAYNPDSPLTKELVQAYHRWDIELSEIKKALDIYQSSQH